ncbi:MAG: hypothetical protein ACI9JM_002255 [Halioglobus sp.]|jgi:hypothetical protein
MDNTDNDIVELDTTPVDTWVGVPLGGGQMKDPVAPNDIRRWAQGMQNCNPLFYDEAVAEADNSRFGELVAPQSFAVCTDDSHGAAPAIQGNIPGTHMLFGGDEWWFYGPRIRPGDKITRSRMLFDYKVSQTGFAGPTMFSRGDTEYVNQSGEFICKQRSTSIRYLAEQARKRAQFSGEEDPTWTEEQYIEIERKKMAYFERVQQEQNQRKLNAQEGEQLPERLIGPHSVASFTSEWRAYPFTIWHTFRPDGLPSSLYDAGWLPEMARDFDKGEIDPTHLDGLYHGPSRGHVQPEFAQLIGLPRAYGYGASMGAWILDYICNWGGVWSDVIHSKFSYRTPAMTGDLTILNGEVSSVREDPLTGQPLAVVQVRMTNQNDEVLATGGAEVRLPTADMPPAERT